MPDDNIVQYPAYLLKPFSEVEREELQLARVLDGVSDDPERSRFLGDVVYAFKNPRQIVETTIVGLSESDLFL